MNLRSARLSDDHDRSRFDSGNAVLDNWLRTHAMRAEQAGICATTVWTPVDAPRVVGFHSIAPTLLTREQMPSRLMAAGHSPVPGYLIGRLALDRDLHGKRLGSQLLLDALEVIVQAADRAGGRVIVVDAVDDALAFSEHHDFIRVGDTNRLVLKIATARRVLG